MEVDPAFPAPEPASPASPAPDAKTEAYAQVSVGFDLGNLFCRVSQIDPKDQMPTIVRNNLSNEQTPGVIAFRQRQERMYGDDAIGQLTAQPLSTVCGLKKLLGTDLTPEFIKTQGLNFRIDSATNTIDLTLEDGPRSVPPTHLVAMILKRLQQFAREQKDVPAEALPGAATVAVPSYFSAAQIGAVSDALLIAGFPKERVHIIRESVAQLVCFHHSHYAELHATNPMLLALVDVGHAQSFVTLARVTKTQIEVLAEKAAPLGAGLLDICITNDAVRYVKEKKGMDISGNPKALARIEKEARKTKEMLSMLESATLTVESLTDEIDLSMPVKREDLNAHAVGLVEQLLQLCQQAMEAAGPDCSLDAIQRVEILGGGIRVPCLQERLKGFWGKSLSTTMDSNLSLAQGAAICGVLQAPTSETTRILDSLVSKADEVRRIMDTLHHVEVVPAPALSGTQMDAEALGQCLQAEAELQARDDRFLARDKAKNTIEAYVYGTRNHLDHPDMQKALGADCDKARAILSAAEEWLWDADEDAGAELFTDKLLSIQREIDEGFPAIKAELDRQAEEQAKKDAKMAEEARKAAAETKREPRTDAERLKFAEERKEQGNGLLKQEHYQESITRYVQALAYLGEFYATEDSELKQKKDAIALSCHLNIANAAIKCELYQKAVDNAHKALEIDPKSAKACFRKGQAYSLKGEFAAAKKALDKALELAPGDKLIEKELRLLAKKEEAHKAKEKKMFGKMFG